MFVHDPIAEFQGKNKWLSTFAPSTVYILIGLHWIKCPTDEHAFQASQTLSQSDRLRIINADHPATARDIGRTVHRVSYWEEVKIVVMLELLRQKFSHVDLARRLRATGAAPLINYNHSHDNFWGICRCTSLPEFCGKPGENWLGKLLMRVREDIR